LNPSCRGQAPTAERTLDPARIVEGELEPRPGIREQPGSKADVSADQLGPGRRCDIGRPFCGKFW
jgi:hypothetical protein